MVSLMALCGACSGAVYRVGDSAGWTAMGGVDYNNWASSKTFHVGDTIVFEYETMFDNVKQVRENDFRTCNVSSPMVTYFSGSDSVTLNRPTNLYFTCDVPGHCEAGQKVEIRVLPASTGSSTSSPGPSTFTFVNSGSPSTDMQPHPAHKRTTSNPCDDSFVLFILLVRRLWMTVLLVLVLLELYQIKKKNNNNV
ncbi:mavicyanin-like [Tripterygium wilfordii]|uniref:mavicyanin-like n=1 Tax=Tripterygium wilfordii TaxID=458696 RepID=UPI0018F833D2|nr:mavicyanin-like [Tripterygium wilfordii]